MASKRLTILGLVVGGVLVLYALGWAATGAGPYYATPAWDQQLDPSTRFVVLTNWSSQAVLDRETGLVWEHSPSTTMQNWIGSRDLCIGKIVWGRKGWRLPSIFELATLLSPTTVPVGNPFSNLQPAPYWLATTLSNDPTHAIYASLSDGGIIYADKADSNLAWCVRGPMNADVC